MRTNSDLLLWLNQILSLVVGMIVVGALGFACCQYGPGVTKCVHDFYHPPNQAQRQAEISKSMMRHVSSPNFEMNDEFRKMFDAREAEFEVNRRLGESYRMPPPAGRK
jgi:hypothetical protein